MIAGWDLLWCSCCPVLAVIDFMEDTNHLLWWVYQKNLNSTSRSAILENPVHRFYQDWWQHFSTHFKASIDLQSNKYAINMHHHFPALKRFTNEFSNRKINHRTKTTCLIMQSSLVGYGVICETRDSNPTGSSVGFRDLTSSISEWYAMTNIESMRRPPDSDQMLAVWQPSSS